GARRNCWKKGAQMLYRSAIFMPASADFDVEAGAVLFASGQVPRLEREPVIASNFAKRNAESFPRSGTLRAAFGRDEGRVRLCRDEGNRASFLRSWRPGYKRESSTGWQMQGSRKYMGEDRILVVTARLSVVSPPLGGRLYHAQAYASTRGSAPALRTPVSQSIMMTAFDPIVHGPVTRTLCPRAASAWRVGSGMRDSRPKSPGYIVCGNGDAGKLRVVQRGASMASWMFMPKSMILISVCMVRMT